MEYKIKISDKVPTDQVSPEFVQGMFDRMAMGFYNYGPIKLNFPENYNALKGCQQRIQKYKKTKNTEWLIDAANFLMIEFLRPSLSGAYFEATSKRESPGSPLRDGRQAKGKEDFDPHTQRIIKKRK